MTLVEALAESLHKAMCYAPETMHNRLACERPNVYFALADAALAHPAFREELAVVSRDQKALVGALDAMGDELAAALAKTPAPRAPVGELDPWQWLHDNEFSWDDVNTIAAILDAGGFEISERRSGETPDG
jgi:hypothetical protein